jgi:hypothetical protein
LAWPRFFGDDISDWGEVTVRLALVVRFTGMA